MGAKTIGGRRERERENFPLFVFIFYCVGVRVVFKRLNAGIIFKELFSCNLRNRNPVRD